MPEVADGEQEKKGLYCNSDLVLYPALSVGRYFIHWETANKMAADKQGRVRDKWQPALVLTGAQYSGACSSSRQQTMVATSSNMLHCTVYSTHHSHCMCTCS